MAKDEKNQKALPPSESVPPEMEASMNAQAIKPQAPDWAKGLRSLYDSVVEEPLPDSFMDLLSKLDEAPE